MRDVGRDATNRVPALDVRSGVDVPAPFEDLLLDEHKVGLPYLDGHIADGLARLGVANRTVDNAAVRRRPPVAAGGPPKASERRNTKIELPTAFGDESSGGEA